MTPADLKKIAAEVSMPHGIRIDADDPIMAVVTLNRLVFEQSVNELTSTLIVVDEIDAGLILRNGQIFAELREIERAGSSPLEIAAH